MGGSANPLSFARARTLLARPDAGRWVALVGSVIVAPSLATGLAVDDWLHFARATGRDPFHASRFELFEFVSGRAGDLRILVETGIGPWFTFPGLRLSFLRPLSSALHVLEYGLWPSAPWAMHAVSIALYAALVLLAARLYRRLEGPAPTAPWTAGLAALMYAVAPGHGIPVGWIANRNAVLAAVFGVGAILAHDRWRRDGWRPGPWVAASSLALALASGESAIATVAYLVAHAVALDEAPARRRALALAPYAGVIAAWQLAYRGLGYGATGSGLYLDPLREPVVFASEAGQRLVALIVGSVATPPSDVVSFLSSSGVRAFTALGLVVLAWVGWVLRPLIQRDRAARFFAVGAVLAAVPICATFPSNRLLLFVDLGALGLVARLLTALSDRAPWLPAAASWQRPARALGALLWVVHVAAAPPLLAISACVPRLANALLAHVGRHVASPESLAGRTVVAVNSPSFLLNAYGFMLPRWGRDAAARLGRTLATGSDPVHVHRPDRFTLVIRPELGFLREATTLLVRGPAHPMRVGETVDVGGMTAEVLELNAEGRPAEVRFRFERPLEDPSFYWVGFVGTAFEEIRLPEPGESMVIAGGP